MHQIKHKNQYGFINSQGDILIRPQFEAVRDFNEGLAWVVLEKDENWVSGFINENGEFAIHPQFSGYGLSDLESIYFSEGIAPIRLGKKEMTFVDTKGVHVSEQIFDQTFPFSEGMALVKKGDLYGYVDKNTRISIDYKFGQPSFFGASAQFSEGTALVRIMNPENNDTEYFGYISNTGEFLFTEPLTGATPFKEGCAMVRKLNGGSKYSVINKFGEAVFDKRSSMASTYSEGLLAFYDIQTELFGYLNKAGDWAIKPQFVLAQKFTQGLAAIQDVDSGLFGYINADGEAAIHPQFSSCLPFRMGLAFVQTRGESGYINTSGQYVWKSSASK